MHDYDFMGSDELEQPDALVVVEGKRTAVYLLLDASGSMFQNKNEHLGGVNGYLEKLKNDGNRYSICIDLFSDNRLKTIREGNLEDTDFINNDEYITTGGTPLLDATWGIIGKAELKAEKGDRVIVIIQSDGLENSSVEVKLENLKKKIEEKRDKDGDAWLFEFLGMGIDKFQGDSMGFASVSNRSYRPDASVENWSNATASNSVAYASTGIRPEDEVEEIKGTAGGVNLIKPKIPK